MKLNTDEKMTVLEIITLNQEKIEHVSNLIELMFKGELLCLLGCFGK